ncbi:MAG: outer membrane beta-barrel protein [Pseudomonadota bacterium]
MSSKTGRLRAITPNLFNAHAVLGLLAAAAVGMPTVARAADTIAARDVFVPAPPAITETSRWSGIYVGFGLSGLIRDTRIDKGAGNPSFSQGTATITPSLYAGYNFDGPGSLVWGFEGDLTYSGKGTTFTDPVLGTFQRKGRFMGTARVRAGIEAGNALFYGTAGLALTNYEIRPSTVTNNDVNWRAGVAVGAGIEYALNDNWSVRGEGIYTHFGKKNITFAGTSREVKDRFGQVRIGFTRSF